MTQQGENSITGDIKVGGKLSYEGIKANRGWDHNYFGVEAKGGLNLKDKTPFYGGTVKAGKSGDMGGLGSGSLGQYQYGAYGNYGSDSGASAGAYGKLGPLSGSAGYNFSTQSPEAKIGIGYTFQKGGVKQYDLYDSDYDEKHDVRKHNYYSNKKNLTTEDFEKYNSLKHTDPGTHEGVRSESNKLFITEFKELSEQYRGKLKEYKNWKGPAAPLKDRGRDGTAKYFVLIDELNTMRDRLWKLSKLVTVKEYTSAPSDKYRIGDAPEPLRDIHGGGTFKYEKDIWETGLYTSGDSWSATPLFNVRRKRTTPKTN